MMANGVENYTSRYNDKYVLNSAPLRLRRNVRKWPTGLYCIVETDTYSVKDQVHFGISWQACVPSPKSKSKILNKQRNYVMWIVLFQRRDVFVKTKTRFSNFATHRKMLLTPLCCVFSVNITASVLGIAPSADTGQHQASLGQILHWAQSSSLESSRLITRADLPKQKDYKSYSYTKTWV